MWGVDGRKASENVGWKAMCRRIGEKARVLTGVSTCPCWAIGDLFSQYE